MSERVTMPALGESVTEGTVTRWLKNVGDTVEVDEPLLEVSTDKVDTEIPSPVAGVLQEILVNEDDTVPVGADLAVIGDGSAAESSGDQGGGAAAQGGQQQVSGEAQQDQAQQAQAPEEQPQEQPPSPQEQGAGQQQGGQQQGGQQQGGQQQGGQQQGGGQQQQGGQQQGGAGEGQRITMPALGESVTEGTVTRWLKSEGDTVEVDEAPLEVSTDKVDTEIPSPVAGVLTKILVNEDDTVPVGADLAIIGGSAGGAQQSTAPAQQAPAQPEQPQQAPAQPEQPQQAPTQPEQPQQTQAGAQPQAPSQTEHERPAQAEQRAQAQEAPQQQAPQQQAPQQQAPSQPQQAAPSGAGGQGGDASAYVTPLVRKLAAEHGVDLGSLQGTGIGGRIRKQDVLDAAKAREAQAQPAQPVQAQQPAAAAAAPSGAGVQVSPKRGTTEKMSRLRKVIAQRMVESLQVSAQLTTVVEVDVTKIARLRDRTKKTFEEREGTKLSFLPFFALAAVEALKQHPSVNSSVEGDQITYHGAENLGIAVDTDRGLLVPVIKDAGDLNIAGLARKIADLAERTRTNKVSPDELGGGTFTLTNTGSRGALFDTPIINQPNVGILGTGAVVERPVVVKDTEGGRTIAIRSMVYLALSYDHRVVDGADAARFLTTMKARLEEGAFEV